MTRHTPSVRREPRRRRRSPVPALLLCLALFCGGFFLGQTAGQAQAAEAPPGGGTAQDAGVSQPADAPGESGQTETLPESSPIAQEPALPAVDKSAWNLRLINWENPLPEDYEAGELTELSSGHAVDSRIYPALQEMMDDAREAGYQPLICSSFRTWDKQAQLYERKVQYYIAQGNERAQAEDMAAMWVARPGTSEHQAGLAVDIVSVEYQVLDQGQEETALQQWLMAHCWEYGFILRYPTDKSELTGVGYEPWHYRYVGTEAAKAITEQGICLEEYLAQ